MADKHTDKPEFHTPKAKFSKAAKAVGEPIGEFFGHWGRNATLRGKDSRTSGMQGFINMNSALVFLAATGSFGYAFITDIDPAADRSLYTQRPVIAQDSQGQVSDGLSILEQNGQQYALVVQNGQYQFYMIDHSNERWTFVDDPALAARLATSIVSNLENDMRAKEQNFLNDNFPPAYVSTDLSVAYRIQSPEGAADLTPTKIQRFGRTVPLEMNPVETYTYYQEGIALWRQAATQITSDTYGLGTTPIVTAHEKDFDLLSRSFDNYSSNYMLGWMALLVGGGALALGQTGASAVRRRRDKKNTPR